MVTLKPGDGKALRDVVRDPATTVVHIDASGGLRGADFSARLESVALPTVATVGGDCDASALALLAAVSLGFVAEDLAVSLDADTVLAFGLTASLPAAIGAAPARSLLLGAGPLDAAALVECGLARPAAQAPAAIARLGDPSVASLVRSLRVAARSTPRQAREYDAELRRIG